VHDAALDRRDFTGGGSLGFSRAIGRYMQWRANIEAGKSFYPRFDQAMPAAGTGMVVRASTHLEARLGR